MTPTTIRTSRKFEAAHRQMEDIGKCGFVHGHNWIVDMELTGIPDTHVGYVIDFKDLYGVVDAFDHTTMLRADDPLVEVLSEHGQRLVILPLNATCENLAGIIANRIEALVALRKVRISHLRVVVHENDHSNATIERNYPRVVF